MATGDEIKLPLTSRDVSAERLVHLRELFPEAFTEGKLDLKKFPQLLGDAATDAPERYGLSWSGKSEAIRNIQTLTSGTLLPARDESVNFDTTENLIIEGDNLETLKLLQGGYHGRVKMIYIDPPYNTGNEFIYPDNFKEGLADYLRFSGQVSGEGIKLATNTETDGRYHSKWLTMMYPRLFLARNLLREDGVIFVSIDDHEVHNLRAVMNEIFGEENFVANIVWQKKYSVSNDDTGVGTMHDYIVAYSKSDEFERGLFPRTEEQASRFSNPDNDPRGDWASGEYISGKSKEQRPTLWYSIRHPKTKEEIWPPPHAVWRYSKEKHLQIEKEHRLFWGAEQNYRIPRLKRYKSEAKDGVVPSTWWPHGEAGHNDAASKELAALMEQPKTFDNPKPTSLLKRLLDLADSQTTDLILDFFGGSGTTAQAVMELNVQDGGNRKFILVQLPEPTERKDFPTIADITKERVRRVIKKLETEIAAKEHKEHKENEGTLPFEEGRARHSVRAAAGTSGDGAQGTDAPYQPKPDLGFKVFKLSSSNFKVWDAASAPKDAPGLAEQLKLMSQNVVEHRGELALLYELVVKSNLPLTSKVVSGKIGSHTFYDVADGTLVICLEKKITQEILRGIMARKPKGVICLDVAFAGNDQLKTNIVLEMKSQGIEFHTA